MKNQNRKRKPNRRWFWRRLNELQAESKRLGRKVYEMEQDLKSKDFPKCSK